MRSFVSVAPVIVLSLTACAGASFRAAQTPLVVDYTAAFQQAAADELASMPVACQPNDPTTPPGCSAVRTLVNDYKHLRDRLRAR